MKTPERFLKYLLTLVLAVWLAGCAHSPNDPLEGYNRQAFHFNEMLDTVVIKPAAHTYKDLTPGPVQTALSNFFANIGDVWIAFNHFLQGRGDDGFSDVSRIIINTFAGLGGLIDVATDAGLPKHSNDLGRTFGVWGASPGPYIMLPLLGPSTLRDTIAAPADYWFGDPITYVSNDTVLWSAIVVRGVVRRAALIDAASVIDDAAIDKYEFVRDAWLQRRQHLIESGRNRSAEWETVEIEGTAR